MNKDKLTTEGETPEEILFNEMDSAIPDKLGYVPRDKAVEIAKTYANSLLTQQKNQPSKELLTNEFWVDVLIEHGVQNEYEVAEVIVESLTQQPPKETITSEAMHKKLLPEQFSDTCIEFKLAAKTYANKFHDAMLAQQSENKEQGQKELLQQAFKAGEDYRASIRDVIKEANFDEWYSYLNTPNKPEENCPKCESDDYDVMSSVSKTFRCNDCNEIWNKPEEKKEECHCSNQTKCCCQNPTENGGFSSCCVIHNERPYTCLMEDEFEDTIQPQEKDRESMSADWRKDNL